ncbi:MAG: DUF4296 domain-containing protein [Muribaculaceae bacterium]|nr:DUF4296 domain-containing protein [Muribaculaceae bacterium]
MIKKYLSIFAITALLASGCSKRPKGILSEEKMVAVMTDLQIAEAYDRSGDANGYLQGKDREMLGRGVLMQHGVSPEEMDSTLAWYGRNMDEYPKLYKKIDAELNKRQLKYARAAGESENEGSSADLWPYSHHFVVDDKSLTRGIVASIPITDLDPGVKLIWKMEVQGASSRTLTLGVDYDNGTSELFKTTNRGYDRWVETSLQTDSAKNVSRIFAIADFEKSNPRILIDSIQLTHLPFNREEYGRNGFQRLLKPAGRKVILPPDTSTNSSLVPDSITSSPSLSTEKSLGVKTRR